MQVAARSVVNVELGDLIGATRESVNKQLREWTRNGIVKQERDSIEIFDLQALEAVAASR